MPVAMAMKELLEQRVDWSSPAGSPRAWPWPVLAEILPENLTAAGFDPASGTLSLRASSPAWAAQAHFLRDQIIHRVNEALGTPTVLKVAVLLSAPSARSAEPTWAPYAFTAPTRIRTDARLADTARVQADLAPHESSSAFPPRSGEALDRAAAVQAKALARARSERHQLS
ncbi:DciA family protein [Streptomyces sp. NPDC087218]|uniref:DciA family protein n=1 Tax=Streptomyces sp. NPDC087218 TaxID=3365769 RepID=UPI003817E2D8